MTKQELEALEQRIFASFWRANEMTRKQAEDYAALAVSHFKRAMHAAGGDIGTDNSRKAIRIEVRGGCVVDVCNLPPGFEYEVKDWDDVEAAA